MSACHAGRLVASTDGHAVRTPHALNARRLVASTNGREAREPHALCSRWLTRPTCHLGENDYILNFYILSQVHVGAKM